MGNVASLRKYIRILNILSISPTRCGCIVDKSNFFLCRYKTKKLLHNHIQTTHIRRNTKHICEICAKVTCSKQTLKEHLKTHYESQPLKCNECEAWLKNQSTLIRHMQTHTDEQQTCDICFKVKPNRNALKNHKRTTHGAAKHKCTFCDKSFRRLVSLKVSEKM